MVQPGDAEQRISNLSRAYRVNLTVLALVALFTGAFLVFSVLALSVAKRAQQFARRHRERCCAFRELCVADFATTP